MKLVLLQTLWMMLTSTVIYVLYGERFLELGEKLLTKYGQSNMDIMLYLTTVISSSPLTLPVSAYAVLGTLLGLEPVWLITAITLGAITS